jgi:N-dimethylarginine dimethylaminohydrolase
MLREAGFTPLELDTSEFIKAGGSVFCMKLMFW